jgi:hypothetical protein
MATILDKDVTRESTVKVDEREIQVTMTGNQTIYMKLKGMKSGGVEIDILELYNSLKGGDGISPIEQDNKSVIDEKVPKYVGGIDLSGYKGDDRFLISLHDIRHALNCSQMEYDDKVIFENFMVNLINERKEKNK